MSRCIHACICWIPADYAILLIARPPYEKVAQLVLLLDEVRVRPHLKIEFVVRVHKVMESVMSSYGLSRS